VIGELQDGRFNTAEEPQFLSKRRLVVSSAGLDVLEKRKIFCPYGDSKPGWSIA
jgi:hypothetical protein